MGDTILTIVTSTFNRRKLLENNLKKMLACDDKRIRFVISDNASTDDTWDMLSNIKDDRVTIYRNEENLDIVNATLCATYVKTPFFMFVNDRDFIENEEIESLCSFLEQHNDIEILASVEGSRYLNEGYVIGAKFADYYNLANHPGTMIFNTNFYNKNINHEFVYGLALKKNTEEVNAYATYQLLLNINNGYYRPLCVIIQPADRDKILKQSRRELYGTAYVLPGYHNGIYGSLIKYAQKYSDVNRIAYILLATFKSGIYKTEYEFYCSVQSEDFKKRNNCMNSSPKDWEKNGWEYTKYVIGNPSTATYISKIKIIQVFITSTLFNALRILRLKLRDNFGIDTFRKR